MTVLFRTDDLQGRSPGGEPHRYYVHPAHLDGVSLSFTESVQDTGGSGGRIKTPTLQSVLSTVELSTRPSRAPDYAAESRALIALAERLATSPVGILQKLAETALTLCGAQSAGISLLEADGRRFYWPAIAGQWAEHLGGGTPREYGPCGTVLDNNTALLFSHPERDFDYFAPVIPLVEEALLMPFYINGNAVGTVWIIAHDQGRRFEAEDLRLMTDLGTFAASAYQAVLSLNAIQAVAAVVESSDDAIVTKDLTGIITSWNRGAEKIFGYKAGEIIGKPGSILISADHPNEEPDILERIRRGERINHYETVRVRKDGTPLNISLTVSPIRDSAGKIVGASKIARDITERKRMEAERRRTEAQNLILANEAEHRTKNILQNVQATVRLTKAENVADFKCAIDGRIQALANVNALFVKSRWVGAELHALVTQELAPYRRGDAARVGIEGPEVVLEPNTAQAIAVIFHELATNAAKHGALSVEDGRIFVAWSRSANGGLILGWSESGGPTVAVPTQDGFGTRVMRAMMRQANGEMRLDWHPAGIVCEIVLPPVSGAGSTLT
jgi:PAS domain S-box-containing protein